MSDSVARHLRQYLGTGFWTTVVAALANGTYWRLPVAPATQRALALATGMLALAALAINVTALARGTVAGGRLGRRVTWLLVVTSALVLATVARFL